MIRTGPIASQAMYSRALWLVTLHIGCLSLYIYRRSNIAYPTVSTPPHTLSHQVSENPKNPGCLEPSRTLRNLHRLRAGKGKGGKGGGKGAGVVTGGQVVKLKQGKKTFEILAKSGAAAQFKEGKISVEDAIEVEGVFYDAHKMTTVSSSDLKSAFGTSDILECSAKILEKGEFSLSTAEKRQKMQERLDEIIRYITLNFRDPATKRNYPRDSIEAAIKTAKLKVDAEKPAKQQIDPILDKLREVLSIERIETDYVIKYHSKYGSVLSILKRYAQVKSVKKDTEEYFVCDVGISPSEFDRLMKELQKPTDGDFEIDAVGSGNEPKAAKGPSAVLKLGKGSKTKEKSSGKAGKTKKHEKKK
ncbi:hypothetical protein AAMO2058_001095200 [Amorphochlora amoebiformis]